MNKNESKYFSTASFFDEALLYLLEEKDIEYITVKEICKKAGLNRSTFYLHYENINDLVEETLNYVNEKFINYFDKDLMVFKDKIKNSSLDDLILIEKRYLTPYLTFIKDNRKIFNASFNNPSVMKTSSKYNHLKTNILIPILDRFEVEEKDYLLTFYINGIISIIKEWVNNNCKDDITLIENIIIKCVLGKN